MGDVRRQRLLRHGLAALTMGLGGEAAVLPASRNGTTMISLETESFRASQYNISATHRLEILASRSNLSWWVRMRSS